MDNLIDSIENYIELAEASRNQNSRSLLKQIR